MHKAYFGTVKHTVVEGDTLSSIAKMYNSTVDNILKFNRIPNPNVINVGQIIIVPLSPPEAIIYTVKRGDSLYFIGKKYSTPIINLIKYNYLKVPYIIYPSQQLVVIASLK